MSKGSRIIRLRIDEPTYEKILKAIESRNEHSRAEPNNLSDWLRKAIQDKLSHIERSRKSTKGKQS